MRSSLYSLTIRLKYAPIIKKPEKEGKRTPNCAIFSQLSIGSGYAKQQLYSACRIKNPITPVLTVITLGLLCFVGVSMIFDLDELFRLVAKPLVLLCAFLVSLYTVFAWRRGVIGMVGPTGKIALYSRRSDPILFFVVALLYLALALPTAWYIASLAIK